MYILQLRISKGKKKPKEFFFSVDLMLQLIFITIRLFKNIVQVFMNIHFKSSGSIN